MKSGLRTDGPGNAIIKPLVLRLPRFVCIAESCVKENDTDLLCSSVVTALTNMRHVDVGEGLVATVYHTDSFSMVGDGALVVSLCNSSMCSSVHLSGAAPDGEFRFATYTHCSKWSLGGVKEKEVRGRANVKGVPSGDRTRQSCAE